jgi:hypothetical protein
MEGEEDGGGEMGDGSQMASYGELLIKVAGQGRSTPGT